MPTTQTLRDQYTKPIITGFHRSGTAYGKPIGVRSELRPVVFYAAGSSYPTGRVELLFHPLAVPFMAGLAAVLLHHRYAFEETAGGSTVFRNITGASASAIREQVNRQRPLATSLHAHGIAVDINPSRNRYRIASGGIQWGRQTDMSPELIKDVEAIRTVDGKRALEWGGRWTNIKDPMHFELDVVAASARLGVNIATVAGADAYRDFVTGGGTPTPPPTNPDEEETMALRKGDKGRAVADHQAALIDAGYNLGQYEPFEAGYPAGADGDFGPGTEAAVASYQTAYGLEATGVIDGVVSALLLRVKSKPTPPPPHTHAVNLAGSVTVIGTTQPNA